MRQTTRHSQPPPAPPGAQRPVMESLEGRLLLSTWVITGENTGTVDGAPFNEANLVGTPGEDAFVFASDSARITGRIDGAGGDDTIVYSATAPGTFVPGGTPGYTADVDLNLQTGEATATGGMLSVESFVGGAVRLANH